MTIRVAIVAISRAPYREPIFKELAKMSHLEVRVFYGGDRTTWEFSKNDGYNFKILPFLYIPKFWTSHWGTALGFSIWRELEHYQPDIVISYGYVWMPMMLACLWGMIRRVPFLIRNDANALGDHSILHKIRRRSIGFFLKVLGAGALAVGRSNTKYWKTEMGFPAHRIYWAPYAINNAFYEKKVSELKRDKEELKVKYGCQSKKVILFVGRLAPEKNVRKLLEAYRALSVKNHDVHLILAGDGPEKEFLTGYAEDNGLDYTLTGFIQLEQLIELYALSDVFVLPSLHEPWGLVVNEAMASGLPAVVSDRVGAGIDLVRDRENGRVFPSEDTDALAQALADCLSPQAEGWGHAALRSVSPYDVSVECTGFIKAISHLIPASGTPEKELC